MKPVSSPNSKPAPPAAQPSQRSTVLLSLLLCPHGGVATHRHGQGAR